jgi:uncharacterized protein YciI
VCAHFALAQRGALDDDRAMSSYFFVRLFPNRADFPANMTAEEGAAMQQHSVFIQEQLAKGTLVVSGPVLDPGGVFGMAVLEADSLEAVRALLATDAANRIGRYEITPMASAVARAK